MKCNDTLENLDKAVVQLNAFPPFIELIVEIVRQSGATFPTHLVAVFPSCDTPSVDELAYSRFNRDRVDTFDVSVQNIIDTAKADQVTMLSLMRV